MEKESFRKSIYTLETLATEMFWRDKKWSTSRTGFLMDRKEKNDEFLSTLNLQQFIDFGVRFDVEYRDWQGEFQPNGGVWRRFPVLFN